MPPCATRGTTLVVCSEAHSWGTSAVCQCYDQVGEVSALGVRRSVAMAPEAIAPPNLGSLRDRESPSGLAGLLSADRMPRAELSASTGRKGDGGVATHRHITML